MSNKNITLKDGSNEIYPKTYDYNVYNSSNQSLDNTLSSINTTITNNNSAAVHITGTETITGAKTFTASPIVPTAASRNRSTTVANTLWVLDNVYPVGSIYTSMNNTSPASLFGGTWASLPEGYFLQTLSDTTTLTSDNISGTAVAPNDTNANTTRKISSGLPDIGGDFKAAGCQAGIDGYAGAFYAGTSGSQIVQPSNSGSSNRAKFLASKGELHSGSYVNNVYGKSEVVQPQSIKVYMWRRTA